MKFDQHFTKDLAVVLYGCENWYLALRVEKSLRVFENRVLRTISVRRRDEVRVERVEKTA
jgi:hypothetical protein